MTLAIVFSRASIGITAPLVTVEAHLSNGMAGFHIVGLPEVAVKESRDRVRSAIVNSQFEFPIKHITINLAPADLPKEGGRFDLPIALGILAASGQIPLEVLAQYEFTGELALSGELRAIRGMLPVVLGAYGAKRQLIVPAHNADEAALVQDAAVLSAKHLLDVCAHLQGERLLSRCERNTADEFAASLTLLDMADVQGQLHAKRALEVAAAGKHSLLFMGPPGTGKTMLASRLTTILPGIDHQAALEVAAIASISGSGFDVKKWRHIPFRSPHHTSSSAALVGGGRPPRPGEISLAHQGVLFLDELPEFSRHVLECLREPLESGLITISRAAFQTIFPAQFQFIAAMNPCPCGYAGSALNRCQCSREQIKRYLAKLSGPLLDRIDMQIEVAYLSPDVLTAMNGDQAHITANEKSAVIRERVLLARSMQITRQQKCNAHLSPQALAAFCPLSPPANQLLSQVMQKFLFSARVYHRIVKVARTIADLAHLEVINEHHIAEALSFRCLDKMKTSYG